MPFWDAFFKPNVEKLKAKRDVEGLIKALSYEKDLVIRIQAAHGLGSLGEVKAVGNAIKTSDTAFSETIVRSLGGTNDDWAIDLLIEALEYDTYSTVNNAAASCLGDIDDPRTIDPLIRKLKAGRSVSERESAAQALCKKNDIRIVEPLLTSLESDKLEQSPFWLYEALGKFLPTFDIHQRARIAIACKRWDDLAALGADSISHFLTAISRETDTYLRQNLLGKIKSLGNSVIDPIIVATKNDNESLREAAAIALSQFDQPKATNALIAILSDKSRSVRKAAAKALSVSNASLDESQQTRLAIAKENWNDVVSMGAIAVDPLIETLLSGKSIVEKMIEADITRTLRKIGDVRAVEPLLKHGYIYEACEILIDQISNIDSNTVNRISTLLVNGQYKVHGKKKSEAAGDAQHVTAAIHTLLKNHASHITSNLLRDIMKLQDHTINFQVSTTTCGDDGTRESTSDNSHLRQLARQELIRRGEQA